MTQVTIFGIRNCSTMKKAFDWFESQGLEFDFHDYKKAGINPQTLQHWLERVEWQDLINKRGTTWRKLTPEQQTVDSAEEAVELMCAHPSLIRRPVIASADHLLIGYNESEYQQKLGA